MATSDEFKNLGIRETLEKIGSRKSGLSEAEAEKRLGKWGYNQVEEKRQNYFLLFAKKFTGPVPLLLILIIILSYFLGNTNDVYIVVALLLLNTTVAFYEEYRADLSIQALKQRLESNSRVTRSGTWKTISSRLLVPGDVIRIRFGDIVPADAKIIECDYLEIDESVITGESLPVTKESSGIAYAGSVVRAGEATCVVIRTGGRTLYGKTATLVELARPKHHIQSTIMHMVKYLVAIDVLIIIVLFLYGTLALHSSPVGMLPFLLIVFLASVPVALPPAFTVAMALGTEKLQKKSILVRKLDAIEDTATMDVLCMDKTGTLTKNKIAVKEIRPFNGAKEDELVRYAAEASREEDRDPIDNALLNYAKSRHVRTGKQLSFKPFRMSTKRTEALIRSGGKEYSVVKGAVQVIMDLCGSAGKEKAAVSNIVNEYAKKGYRSLAIAVGRQGKLRLVGVIALYDELRDDAKDLIRELSELGVDTKMLTGDNVAVARETARSLDLRGGIIDLSAVKAKGRKLFSMISHASGFSNIFPEDKYTIVKALQSHHNITGMTGDGINDAPALKQAEVGIAVSNATDVAKGAAAMVITEEGIGVIVEAVKESRRIFERMLTYAMTKISKVVQIVGFIAILYLGLHGFVAITPFLLILLMFTNDMVNIAIATDNAAFSMTPDIWKVRSIMYAMGIVGAVLVAEALFLLPMRGIFGLSLAQFQTCAFLLLDISDKFSIFNLREKSFFWKSRPSNALLVSSGIGIAAGLIFSYYGILVTKINAGPILSIIGLSIVFLFLVDLVKVSLFKSLNVK